MLSQWANERSGRHTMQRRQKTQAHNWKKPYLVAVVLLLVSIGVAGGGWSMVGIYNTTYQKEMSLAQTGLQHMRNAQTMLVGVSKASFNPATIRQARSEFSSALIQFTQLNKDISLLPAISTSLPVYGTRLHAAIHLAPLATSIAEVGIEGCDVLTMLLQKFQNPLNVHGQGLTMEDLLNIEQHVQRIRTALSTAVNEADQVPISELQFDAHAVKMFALFKQYVPTIRTWLDTSQNLMSILPTFLGIGTPANYLLEILDSTELRPGGGFIGNYGIATLSGGRLTSARISDTSLLDHQYLVAGHTIAYPSDYLWFYKIMPIASWSLRDSNLDADFPTAARYAEQNFKLENGGTNVQGVIAITPVFVQHIFEITGPIEVPEYNEVITAQNLSERIHYHQLGAAGEGSGFVPSADGHSSMRKRFTELLSEHLLARIRSLPASSMAKLLPLLLSSLHTKDIQVYFNATSAEQMLQRAQRDATIRAPQSDSLFVVDANAAADKANSFITSTMQDSVTIDRQGNSVHATTLTYAWTKPGTDYGNPLYQDYVRVYVPPQSTLLQQSGWQANDATNDFGRSVWRGFFTLRYGQMHTITLSWRVPKAAQHDASSWHYHLLVQRQAGVVWTVHMQTTLPSCATVMHTSSGISSPGKQRLLLTTSLTEDTDYAIDYTC